MNYFGRMVFSGVLVLTMFVTNVSAVLAADVPGLSLSASDTLSEVNAPILVIADMTSIGSEGAVMSLTDGGDGGTFFEASGDTCGETLVGSFAIPAETTSIQFCYTNSTPGTYNIVADLEGLSVSDSIALEFFINTNINLELLSSTVDIEEGLQFSGNVYANEGHLRPVQANIYSGSGCDSEVYMMENSDLVPSEVLGSFTYSGSASTLEAGDFSIRTILYSELDEILATSECLDFTVTGRNADITIEKVVEGYTGEEPWSFDFYSSMGNFTLYQDVESEYERKTPASAIYSEVEAGEVTVTELEKTNWRMTDVSCHYNEMFVRLSSESEEVMTVPVSVDYNNQTFTVDISSYESVTCVVTNTFAEERNSSSGTKVGAREKSLATAPKAPTVAQDTTVPTCQLLLNDYLRKGWDNKADEVTKLQKFLNEQGIVVPVTGFFGDLTEEAVKKFQAEYLKDILSPWGIDYVTGFVYKTTRYKINNMVCPGSEEMPTL